MIRLRATRQRGLLPALIRAATLCDYDHIEIALADGWFLGAHPDGGVQERHPKYIEPLAELYVMLDAPAVDEWVLHNARKMAGRPYDWSAYLPDPRRDWRQTDRWICSELIAWAFEEAGCPILCEPIQHIRLSPRDILLSPYIRVSP